MKQIEEMAKVICQECITATEEKNCQNEVKDCMAYECAKLFYNAGYRKVNDGDVLMSKEIYLEMCEDFEAMEKQRDNTRKETAREIIEFAEEFLEFDGEMLIPQLRKKFGVEVE